MYHNKGLLTGDRDHVPQGLSCPGLRKLQHTVPRTPCYVQQQCTHSVTHNNDMQHSIQITHAHTQERSRLRTNTCAGHFETEKKRSEALQEAHCAARSSDLTSTSDPFVYATTHTHTHTHTHAHAHTCIAQQVEAHPA